MASTFVLTCFAWIFFRANNMEHAIAYINGIFSESLFISPISDIWTINTGYQILLYVGLLVFFIVMEWINRDKQYGLQLHIRYRVLRWLLYYFVILSCFMMNGIQQEFIYFQF